MFDLHCHILPGIDDGPADVKQSIAMCKLAKQDGIRGIVATPHHANGVYTNRREEILSAVHALNIALHEAGETDLVIYPGSEVHFHEGLQRRIARGELCTYADAGCHVLIEPPVQILPGKLKDEIFQLKLAGITPIIAHPERNRAVQENPNLLIDLVEMGALCQVTAQSVSGDFGAEAEKISHFMIRSRLAHIVASDAHSSRSRPPKLREGWDIIEKLLIKDPLFFQFMHSIPPMIIRGEKTPDPPPYVESIASAQPSLWKRLFAWVSPA